MNESSENDGDVYIVVAILEATRSSLDWNHDNKYFIDEENEMNESSENDSDVYVVVWSN